MGVSLPIPFINEIRKHIANDERYRNVPQFVAAAVREKMNPPKTVYFAPEAVKELATQISGEIKMTLGYSLGDTSVKSEPVAEKTILVKKPKPMKDK